MRDTYRERHGAVLPWLQFARGQLRSASVDEGAARPRGIKLCDRGGAARAGRTHTRAKPIIHPSAGAVVAALAGEGRSAPSVRGSASLHNKRHEEVIAEAQKDIANETLEHNCRKRITKNHAQVRGCPDRGWGLNL